MERRLTRQDFPFPLQSHDKTLRAPVDLFADFIANNKEGGLSDVILS